MGNSESTEVFLESAQAVVDGSTTVASEVVKDQASRDPSTFNEAAYKEEVSKMSDLQLAVETVKASSQYVDGMMESGVQDVDAGNGLTLYYYSEAANNMAMDDWETGEKRLEIVHAERDSRNK